MAWLSRSDVDFGIEADPPLDDDDPKLNRFILVCFWPILTCAEGRVVVVVNAEAPIANNKMEQNFIVKNLTNPLWKYNNTKKDFRKQNEVRGNI